MITAVDTNVLLDIFGGDPRFGPGSALAIKQCRAEGAIVACEVVWAEVAAGFPDVETATNALKVLGVEFVPLGQSEAAGAGQAWREYRRAGGGRERVAADFLIAAHAAVQADRLLTRDRGFYRRYFATLQVLDPRGS